MAKAPGRVRIKLASMLTDKLGFPVYPDDFESQAGDYRKSRWDLARWTGSVSDPAYGSVVICSWDTMTESVRNGFTIRRDELHGIEVHALERTDQ